MRGADLVDSTPRQIWLARRAWACAAPSYAHVPLVLGEDGRRLAKRHGDVTLREVSVDAALAWMAESLGLPGAHGGGDAGRVRPGRRLPREPTTYHA